MLIATESIYPIIAAVYAAMSAVEYRSSSIQRRFSYVIMLSGKSTTCQTRATMFIGLLEGSIAPKRSKKTARWSSIRDKYSEECNEISHICIKIYNTYDNE